MASAYFSSTTITVKIPEALNVALLAASQSRQVSKSSIVREALELALATETNSRDRSTCWLEKWRGNLVQSREDRSVRQQKSADAQHDERVAQLLAKHLR